MLFCHGYELVSEGNLRYTYDTKNNHIAMAALCFMDTTSFVVGKIGRLVLKGSKLKNTGVLIIRSSAVLSKISNMGQNIYAGIDSIYRMHEEGINGWDIFSLGVSAVGTFFSAKGLMDEVGAFRGTCCYKGFWGDVGGEIKTAAKEWWANQNAPGKNRGCTNIELLVGKRIANAVSKGGRKNYTKDFADLATYRKQQGMPVAGSIEDKHTAAKLIIGDNVYFGKNGHGKHNEIKRLFTINLQTATHAEGDVFYQAKMAGCTDLSATLITDRCACRACGYNGGIRSLARQMGINNLTIVSPNHEPIRINPQVKLVPNPFK